MVTKSPCQRKEALSIVTLCKLNLEKKDMSEVVFWGLATIMIVLLWRFAGEFLLNCVIRCLFGLVCIYFCNDVIAYFGGDLSVKINEISACASAILGMSGVAGLYVLQLYFTMR